MPALRVPAARAAPRAALLAAALCAGGTDPAVAATLDGTGYAAAVRPPTWSAAWIARLIAPTPIWRDPAPRRPVTTLSPTGPWTGGPVGLLVVGTRRDGDGHRWLRVALPERPNGRTGWLAADRVALARTQWRLEIRTSTPTGRFAVYEKARQADPHGFLGPWALHLTGHSDVLDNYGGGPGRVAIHGRDGASLKDPLGSARSHGCIRIDDRRISLLARRLRSGTPVTIHL